MSTVSYNGNKLIPAPFIGIDKSYYKFDNQNVGSTYQISLQGTIISFTGIPTAKTNWDKIEEFPNTPDNPANNARLGNILRKQELIRSMFSEDFKLLEVQSANGSYPMKCRPRILSISFEPDIWFNTCKYTVQMEAPELSVFGQYHGNKPTEDTVTSGNAVFNLVNADENWSTEYDDGRDIFVISHTLRAQGRPYYNLDGEYTSAADNAQKWINLKRGPAQGVVNSGVDLDDAIYSTDIYDYAASRQVSSDGTVELSENWVLSSKPYTEEYSINVNESEEGKDISIQGSIQGLSIRSYTPSGVKYTLTKWDSVSGIWPTIKGQLYSRVLDATQLEWVNPNVLSYSHALNKIAGNIQYNYTYNDAPPNLIDGARFERINVNEDGPADVFAIIPVLGRRAGPIIQPINTVTERRRTVTIEVAMTGLPIKTKADKIAYLTNYKNGVRPNWGAITGVLQPDQIKYIEQNQETFDVNSRRYSKVITWVY